MPISHVLNISPKTCELRKACVTTIIYDVESLNSSGLKAKGS